MRRVVNPRYKSVPETKPKNVKKPSVKEFNTLKADFTELSEKAAKALEIAEKFEKGLADGVFKVDEKGFPMVHVRSRTGSEEQKAMSSFRVTDPSKLFSLNTAENKFHGVDKHLKGMVYDLKCTLENARVIAQVCYNDSLDFVGATEKKDRFGHCKHLFESRYAKEELIPKLKAFGISEQADWIPEMISSTFIPEFELDRDLVGNLKPITMTSSPYSIPVSSNLTTARRIAEKTSATSNSFDTNSINFVASKFVEYYEISEEADEDTLPGLLEYARQELATAHLRAFETSVLNGTKIGTTHIDTDTQAGAADLAEKQYHGLRYHALQNTANGSTVDFLNAAATDAKLFDMIRRMGPLSINPKLLMWVTGANSYHQMKATDKVTTVDKMGPAAATILTGVLGTYSGIPIIQSGYMREDMNATGVNDGVTEDRTGVMLVHRDRWYFATRRPIRMALRPSRSKDDMFEIASYSRVDFQGQPQGPKEVGAVYGYNMPTT